MTIVFLVFLVGTLAFILQTARILRIINQGKPSQRKNAKSERLLWALKTTLGQTRIAERSWGWVHIVLMWAFFVFLTSGLEMLIACLVNGYTLAQTFGPTTHAVLCIIQTWFAWLAIAALGYATYRRIFSKKTFTNFDAIFILSDIFLLMASHITSMSANIALGLVAAEGATMLPIESLIATLIPFDPTSTINLPATIKMFANATHLVLMAIFLVWIPNSKHLHILLAWPDAYYAFSDWRQNDPAIPVLPGSSRRSMDSDAMFVAVHMAHPAPTNDSGLHPKLIRLQRDELTPKLPPHSALHQKLKKHNEEPEKQSTKLASPQKLPIFSPPPVDFDAYEKACCAALDANDEVLPTIGLRNFSDTTRKQRLEAFCCTLCKRCTNVCPMVKTNLTQAGPMSALVSLRKLCVKSNKQDPELVPTIMSEQDMWNCTMCGACDRACPISHEHTLRTLMMRQNAVAQQTNVPQKLAVCYNNVERNGNPWGYPARERSLFIKSPYHKTARIVIFSGCMASYDKIASKTLNAVIAWLEKAGFEVMTMHDEICCGEPLRATGNELGFQTVARANIEKLNATKAKLVLTTCPHCAFTLSDSYRAYGFKIPTMHIVQFWTNLLKAGQLTFKKEDRGPLALHMPCYLAKKSDETKNVVRLLTGVGYDVKQTEDAKQASCCGAGGGQFFFANERIISNTRAKELTQLNTKRIGTLCPFCTQTLSDMMQISGVGTLTTCFNVIESLASGVEYKAP